MTTRKKPSSGDAPRRHRAKNARARSRQRQARRVAAMAFAPATALAVLVLSAVTLAVWSCSSFDPVSARRRTPVLGPATAGAAAGAPSAPVAASAIYATEPDIRVRVKPAAEVVKIESPRPLQASSTQNRATIIPSPVQVTAGPDGIRLLAGNGQILQFFPGAVVTIGPAASEGAAPPPSQTLRLDGTDYPGVIVIRPTSDVGATKFDVIADMSIEDYLPGVLTKELFPKWPLAAYESQAVCARTYALFVRDQDRAAGRPFDVENSTADQVFGGATNHSVAMQAVRDTRGVVLTYGGGLFKAYFSSTCGGRTGSAADVWPITRGFEYNLCPAIQAAPREHYCQQARLYRWEVIRSADDLGKRISTWGKGSGHPVKAMGSLRGVVVEKVNQTSRPARYSLLDDRGRSFSISAEELRVACNATVQGLPAITPQTRINSSDLEFTTVPDATAPTFSIKGRGFGHGVGMCQWCLKGMADRGIPWDQQVLTFYPGAQIVRAYR